MAPPTAGAASTSGAPTGPTSTCTGGAHSEASPWVAEARRGRRGAAGRAHAGARGGGGDVAPGPTGRLWCRVEGLALAPVGGGGVDAVGIL